MIDTDSGNLFSGTAEALWRLGKDNDPVAWSKIVQIHSSGMLHTAKGVLGDHFLGEDAVQNAFLQIRDLSAEYFRRENDKSSIGILGHHHKENTIFKNDFAARNWIIRITYFVAKDMRKSRIASKDREKVYTQNWLEERKNESTNHQELLLMMQGEIEKLPDELRLPIVLRFHCDMNFNQVSSELGLAVHVIRQRVQKGIEVLQSKLSAIIGSSMTVIGVESLLRNVYLLNEGVADSLFKNYMELLDKSALTKSQLLLENKLLLQSPKFMIKGLTMLKIFVVLLVLIGAATIVVNSINSHEEKENKQKNQATVSVNEDMPNKDKKEVAKADGNGDQAENANVIQTNQNAVLSENQITNGSPIELPKNSKFDVKDILPYFSDKAVFTVILPDLNGSANRFVSSDASKFYGDPNVNLIGKLPLILNTYFNIDIQPFTGDMIRAIFEKAMVSFHCLGAQYSVDIPSKTHSYFIVGLLKKEEESKLELLMKILKPFEIESKKNKSGLEVVTYQFSKNQAKYELVRKENMVFIGNADGLWMNNLEKNIISEPFKNENYKGDLCWKINIPFVFALRYADASESVKEDAKVFSQIIKNEFKENIAGEIFIQKSRIIHDISIPMKNAHQFSAGEILTTKNITLDMIKQIPSDQKAFMCLNIDLQKSWANYKGFMDYFFTQAIAINEERFERIKEDYVEEIARLDEMCQSMYQMNFDSLMNKCLTGEIISWISSTPSPAQTVKAGVKDPEFALKLVKGMEAIFGKNSGIQISMNEKYITIILPVPKDFMNQENIRSPDEKISYLQAESGILNKSFVSWCETSLSVNHSVKLLFSYFNGKSQKGKKNDQAEDKDSLKLFLSSLKSSATTIAINKNGFNLEFENMDDMVQLLIGSALLDKRFKIQNDSKPTYTEINETSNVDGKSVNYIESKGYILNGQKTGHWVFYNYNGEVVGEGEFKNGKETGYWKKTDWMGNVCEGEMVDGLQTGQWKITDSFWKIPSYGEMKSGKKVGVWKSYHNKNKKLADEGEYADDKKVGLWCHYHDNGVKEFEENYKDGLLDGERTTWDEQGKITSVGTYSKNQLNGIRREYVNQKLVSEEEAENGRRLWLKTYFIENSNVKQEIFLDRDKSMELVKEYYLNGQLKLVQQNFVFIKNGKFENKTPIPTGEWQEWHENNSKKMVGTFDKEGNGQKIYFYDNGNKCAEFFIEKGILTGKASVWYDNGNLFFVGNYLKSKLNGQSTFWYLNGNKKAEGTYKDGNVSSSWKYWDKSGELKEELNFDKIDEFSGNNYVRENERKLFSLVSEHNFFRFGFQFQDIIHDMAWIKKGNSDEKK